MLDLNAQQITYNVVENNPENYKPRLNINFILCGIDGGYNNFDGLNFYAGTFGNFMLHSRLGVQWNANTAIFTLGRLGFEGYNPVRDLQAGGVLYLLNRQKTRNLKVTLKSTEGVGSNGQRVTTETYIMVPGNRDISLGVRGGLFLKSGAFGLDGEGLEELYDNGYKQSNFTGTGLYAGVIRRAMNNLVIQAEGYGTRMNSLAVETYADVIFSTSNSFVFVGETPLNGSIKTGDKITDRVKALSNESPLGFRIGWYGYQIAPKTSTTKRFGMCYHFEFGKIPYFGWSIRGGLGLTLVKKAAR